MLLAAASLERFSSTTPLSRKRILCGLHSDQKCAADKANDCGHAMIVCFRYSRHGKRPGRPGACAHHLPRSCWLRRCVPYRGQLRGVEMSRPGMGGCRAGLGKGTRSGSDKVRVHCSRLPFQNMSTTLHACHVRPVLVEGQPHPGLPDACPGLDCFPGILVDMSPRARSSAG